jgi:hypothetical protein
MASPLTDRRSGRDRRHAALAAAAKERRGWDRRQFPPLSRPEGLSAEGNRVLCAIDEYKLARGLTRISVDELLAVLAQLGYRRA